LRGEVAPAARQGQKWQAAAGNLRQSPDRPNHAAVDDRLDDSLKDHRRQHGCLPCPLD
jgi:hypothetical protein